MPTCPGSSPLSPPHLGDSTSLASPPQPSGEWLVHAWISHVPTPAWVSHVPPLLQLPIFCSPHPPTPESMHSRRLGSCSPTQQSSLPPERFIWLARWSCLDLKRYFLPMYSRPVITGPANRIGRSADPGATCFEQKMSRTLIGQPGGSLEIPETRGGQL